MERMVNQNTFDDIAQGVQAYTPTTLNTCNMHLTTDLPYTKYTLHNAITNVMTVAASE